MRRLALWIALLPAVLLAQDDEADGKFQDRETGLVVDLPEDWSRETTREGGSIRFAAIWDLTRTKYVLFTVESGPAAGFDEDAWLANEKATLEKALKTTTEPFAKEAIELAGQLMTRYSLAGTRVSGKGTEYKTRFRGAGFVHNDLFFKVSEVSFYDTHKGQSKLVEAMWNAISLDDSIVDGAISSSGDGPLQTAPVEGSPTKVTDENGNFKLTLPPGWVVTRDPNPEPDGFVRLSVERATSDGRQLISINVTRSLETRAEIFSVETAGDRIETIGKSGFFEQWYGDGSARIAVPASDESIQLGGAEKSGSYRIRAVTVSEDKAIREAEKLKARGDKTVKVPEYKPLVLRGRVAMISPYVYHAFAVFNRDVADEANMIAEMNSVFDSWEFISTEPFPPPLVVHGRRFRDTTADPKNAQERKESTIYTEKAVRTFQLEVKFIVPPGFERITKNLAGDQSLLLVAQDDRHNWVKISLNHVNLGRLGEAHPGKIVDKGRKVICGSWKSNWTSKAHGVKRMDKPKKFTLGPSLKGDGYRYVAGTVEGFPGTFTGLVTEKSSWRSFFVMETRGEGHKVFAKEIKAFLRKLKLEKLK